MDRRGFQSVDVAARMKAELWILVLATVTLTKCNTVSDTHISAHLANVTLTFNSADSARLAWFLPDNQSEPETIEIQRIQDDARCGSSNTVLIRNDNKTVDNQGRTTMCKQVLFNQTRHVLCCCCFHSQHRLLWGVNSSASLTCCVRTRLQDGNWSEWIRITAPAARKSPPLLTEEPEEPDVAMNLYSYTGSASCAGSPTPRWRWVINGRQFNTSQRLPQQYGSYSRITDRRQLVISGFDSIADDELAIHYEAENKYGAVKSRPVVITKPYIWPADGNSWDLDYTETVNYTAGIALKCSSYERSWPPMSHSWHYCGSDTCAQLGSQGVKHCPKITDFSSRKFLLDEDKKLVFTYMTKEDTGCYVCQSENVILMEILKSTVTLITQQKSLEFPPKLVHQSPKENIITVVVGETLRLECAFQANPIAEVFWMHNNTSIVASDSRRIIQLFSNTLTIQKVVHSDEGVYKCIGSSGSLDASDQGVFLIHVDVKPRIVGLDSQSGFIGSNITLFCNTAYNSHIRWYKNMDEELTDSSPNCFVSEDKKRMTLIDVRPPDTGTYTCKATNRQGMDVKHATVVVLEPVTVTSIQGAVYQVSNRTIIELSCDVSADVNLDLSVDWRLDGGICREDLIGAETDMDRMTLSLDPDRQPAGQACVVYCYGSVPDMTSCRKAKIDPLEGVTEERECGEPFTLPATTEMGFHGNATSDAEDALQTSLHPRLSESTGTEARGVWLQDNHYVIIGVSLVAALLIAGSVVAVVQYQRQRKASRNGPRLADYGSGGPLLGPVQYLREDRLRMGFVNNSLYTTSILSENLKNQLREVEVPRQNLTLGDMIGRGQFGRVYKGTLEDKSYMNTNGTMTVAIKTLKYKAEENEMVELFLREALMMKGFHHPHVLSLIGITMDTDRSPLVILPFMGRGDLRTYISSPDLDFRVLELLKMGVQVANGMAYLAGKRFVHRDLAARNCMVDKQGIVKVADFGLSRDLYSQEYYRTEDGKNPLPIRWMAVESLDKKIFTTKSDVWSFGVLLWELVTRGATPYPGIENWALAQHIQQGSRMKQPLYCPNSVYEIMLECWNKSPKLRPTFEALQARLEAITATSDGGDLQDDRPRSKLERRSTLDMDIRTARVTKCRVAKDQDLTVLDES